MQASPAVFIFTYFLSAVLPPLPPSFRLLCVVALASAVALPSAPADTPSTLAPLGVGIGGPAYWSRGLFANTMLTAHDWLEFRGNDWGTTVVAWNNPQFDANGYPRFLQPGQRLRTLMWPFAATPANRPATWPRRDREGLGRVVLTWRGEADLRLTGATFLAAESSGAATGRLVDGRRVYHNAAGALPSLTVEDLAPERPLTDIKVWLPDPADPERRSLEGRFWHPNLLATLRDLPFGQLRMMDLGETNGSPQQDWSDRRLPSHRTQHGQLNTRAPAAGAAGNRATGLAWEYMVDLANTLDRDLWICVPHLATDEYVAQLARLIRHGSDGVAPYAAPQSAPVFRPLAPHLRVWVEYSNEIWSSGGNFPQGDWAQAEGAKLGLSKAEFNARRFAQVWRIFQEVFGGSERVVRVAAIFTANNTYTEPFLRELARYGPTLSPAVTADVVSPTTYFGNGIQDWAYDTALRRRTAARPWFLTAADFTAGGVTRPVSVPAADPYWTGPAFSADLAATVAEWKRRIFSGSAAQGAGPDATGLGGGFSDTLAASVRTIFGRTLPIVSYEGGPSLYTDNRDGADARDDGLTTFMEALNRRPEMREILALHLNLAKAKGLRSNTIFVDVGQWGKYGQWGHLEFPDQRPGDSPKWLALRDHDADVRTLRPVESPLGSRPRFETAPRLPAGVFGAPYAAEITVRDGDFAAGRTPRFMLVSQLLDPGLAGAPDPARPGVFRVAGTPVGTGTNYFLLRAADDDGDAAWRIFRFEIGGGPGVIVESRFEGDDPARRLPWTEAFAVAPGVAFSGWRFGAGLFPQAGADALAFTVNAPGEKAQSTAALALADGEFIACTLTPAAGSPLDLRGAEISFAVRRDSFHAPRAWAAFTSIGGFEAAAAVHVTAENTGQGDIAEYAFTLPATAAYAAVTGPFELRLVPFAGQFSNHPAALTAFRFARAGTPRGFGLAVPATTGDTRLANLSSRALAGPGEDALVAGFALRGPREKRVLLRGIGPALGAFGVAGALAEPRLTLFAGGQVLQTNDGWDRTPAAAAIAQTAAQVGAFPLAAGSRDAALLVSLPPGDYTVHLAPARDAVAPGIGLVECYAADSDSAVQLVNLSTLARIGAGAETLIAGFVLAGEGGRRLLLRGVGPGLAAFGVGNALADPQLALYRNVALDDANDDWPDHPARFHLAAVAAASGAFPLAEGARDAALLAHLAPDRYTLHVTGPGTAAGVVLAEIYGDTR